MQRVRSSLSVLALGCLLAFIGFMAFAAVAWAAPAALQLQWGKDINAVHACDELAAQAPVINVVEFVRNDIDSGFNGNWAMDNYTRHIQVYANGDGTFCASVNYQGTFTTIEGLSPGAGLPLQSGITGRMQGGYVGIVTGTLRNEPAWPTQGVVGSFDYGCNASGSTCQYVSWISQYFDGASFNYIVWEWIYRGGKNGTWINADSGSPGDIR